MTGTRRSSFDLDPRRRRALVRSWRRGTREMDLVLGEFADAEIDRLNDQELAAYEALLDVADAELFQWITGEKPVPEVHDTPLLRRLVASRRLPEP
jgi:antitoxin CptB